MRIAIASSRLTKIGGIETYLSSIIPELDRRGHSVAFFHEVERAAEREQIVLPDGSPVWCVAELGAERALAMMRAWRPDLIYAHGLVDPKLERQVLKLAPAVFLAHAYHGTCISGAKCFKSPSVKPCDRRFGWQCMLHYYPHRCGGLSPITMVREHRLQAARRKLLSKYKAVVTLSSHIRNECIKHGLSAERVHCLSFLSSRASNSADLNGNGFHRIQSAAIPKHVAALDSDENSRCRRLLFLGRMDLLKGGDVLIDALAQVCAKLARPVRVTFAGDGPERDAWERRAAFAQARSQSLEIEFVGWVKKQQREALLNDSHLLVVPSVWPEPFGLVGPEAGLHGVPAVAFAVGGITDWLSDGVNGYVAPANPPNAENLAETIVKCFRDPATYARLRRGALEVSRRFKMESHVTPLLEVFEEVARGA